LQASSQQPELIDILVQQLKDDDAKVQAEFTQIENHLRNQNLPAAIIQRHTQAVRQYQQDMANLQEQLVAVAEGNSSAKSKTRQALQRLLSQPTVATQQEAKTAAQVRAPLESVEALETLFPPETTRRSRQTRDGNKPRLPDLNDLAAFGEVQITPEIQALAEELGNHPVNIYYWVRNNISFVPSYGAMQGSQQTLLSRRGNAFDTASLLIALLRAAQIPARYVYGTVQVPANQVMNWVGGVETPQAAMQLLKQGGIPHTAQIEGGQITALTLEHLWVDAWVDYMPSRAAKNHQGDSWIPLDASFKLHEFAAGIDWNGSFAADDFANQLKSGSTYSDTSLINLDTTLLQNTLTEQQDGVWQWLTTNGSDNSSLGELLGQSSLIPFNRPVLAAGLPYRLITRIESRAKLPANLQHHYRFSLYENAAKQNQGEAIFTYNASLPDLAGQSLVLSFVPASADDAAVIASFLPAGQLDLTTLPKSVPGYLVNLKAELRLNAAVVASSAPYVMGH
ncbi:MAG: transglutaminase domain-containing protein, partial [Aestuariibacter sp.]|nr:transglutaminase domain-containing protein [Aestuariibacter sp.]